MPTKGYIYFLQDADRNIKIGHSKDVVERMRALNSKYGPLSLLGFIPSETPLVDEREIHNLFSEYLIGNDLKSLQKRKGELEK